MFTFDNAILLIMQIMQNIFYLYIIIKVKFQDALIIMELDPPKIKPVTLPMFNEHKIGHPRRKESLIHEIT